MFNKTSTHEHLSKFLASLQLESLQASTLFTIELFSGLCANPKKNSTCTCIEFLIHNALETKTTMYCLEHDLISDS